MRFIVSINVFFGVATSIHDFFLINIQFINVTKSKYIIVFLQLLISIYTFYSIYKYL